ncbi:helix-hairpin-helix domain-containing protein [Sulfurimonas sp. HSL-1656]
MSMPLLAGVNLNTATAEELESLKGIGPSTAAKIIEYRNEHRFNSIEDIMNVKGVGEKTFLQIKDELEV